MPSSHLVSFSIWQSVARRNIVSTRSYAPSLALLPISLDSLPSTLTLTSPLTDFLLTHPTFGSFSFTIILLTLGLRTFITLPANLWSRSRMRRMRRLVMPEMKKWNEVLAKKVAGESRGKGMGYEDYKKELKRQLAAQQSILVREHKCHPFLTAVAPVAVHIPSFILLSLGIRGAVARAQEREVLLSDPIGPSGSFLSTSDSTATLPPTYTDASVSPVSLPDLHMDLQITSPLTHAFATEPFFHCPTLVDPDPAMIIPLMIGLAVFANVEFMGMWREGLREMREGGEVAPSPGRGQAPSRSRTTAIPQEEVIDKGRNWMGRRIVQVKRASPTEVPTFATSSINAPRRGSKQIKPSVRPVSTKSRPPSPVLQDETDVGNMTTDEMRKRGVKIETATLRERIVANVLRGFAIVVVGVASQMPVAVAIYWLTSTSYTLFQNWIFGLSDRREERAAFKASLTPTTIKASTILRS